jgi:chromosome segregation ATPase
MATAAQEPLGTLLVKRGLISEEQLAAALADQKETGEPLGKIVVDRGYTRPEVIAQALATQHGGLLKTEYGFATGFGAGLAPPVSVAAPPVTAGAVATAPAEAPPAVVSPPAELRNELAHASEEAEKLRADNERLAQIRTELEQRLANEAQKLAALERDLASAKDGMPANAELEKQIAHEVRRIATLEAEVAARDEAIADFKETAESWKKALVERDDAIRQLVAERNDALAELDARTSNGETPIDTTELDRLRRELAAREQAFADLEIARDNALEQIAAFESAQDNTLAELRAAKADLAQRDEQIRQLVSERDDARAELDARASTIAQLEQAVESASASSADTSEVDELRHDLAAREQAFADIELARDKALKQIAELEAARSDALGQLRAAKADLAERDAKLPELSASRDAALEELQAARVALEGRDAAIADLVAKAETAGEPQAEPDRWAEAERHLLFFQGEKGYELVERSGPPPRAGDEVQVPGGPMVVARLSAAPTPGPKLPCAYLVG